MVYRAIATPSTAIGSLLTVWSWTLGSLLLARAIGWPVSFPAFLAYVVGAALLALGFVFAYWVYAGLSLRYELRGDTLFIQLGPVQQAIPLADVERIVPGYTLPPPRVSGVNWWGLHIGRANLGPEGDAIIYSTHYRPEQLLYVVTRSQVYAISPQQPSRFTRALQAALPSGGAYEYQASPQRQGFDLAAQPFRWDRGAQLLILAGLVLNLAFYGFIFSVFPELPSTLHLSFPPDAAERLGPKQELLELPLVALTMLAASVVVALLVHTRERAAAYFVLAAAAGLQVLLWAASLATVV